MDTPTDLIDEEYLPPPLEALMAGTLALLTGLAQVPAGCARRAPMAAKVRANLAAQPQLSSTLRQMLVRLAAQWSDAAQMAEQEARVVAWPQEPTRWH